MSIVPVSGTDSNPISGDLWDLEREGFFPLLDPFQNFHFPSVFHPLETQVEWRETPRAHVFRGVFPGSQTEEDEVLVYIDDSNTLEISRESGKFTSRFKLPENAERDKVSARMENGVVLVIVPKKEGRVPNVRAIEISGSG